MPPKKINSLEDLNEIKRLMAEGEGRETDALHSRIEEGAYEMRERNFGRGKRMGFEKKRKDGPAHIEPVDELPESPLQYDNSGYSESDIEAALENAKILLGLGFSENEINEAYSQEDLAEILNNNYTKEKWLEISRARFTQKDKKSEEQRTKNENAFFVEEKENKKTIQAKIRILKHDIKLIQFEIAKNKNELKDTSLLDKRLKKLENELAEKQSILDFYDAGLTNEEINKLSDVRNYVNHKKETYTQDQYLKKKGFSQEDINVLTDGERSDILRTGLLKKDFVVDYEDGEYSSGAKIKKIEQGLIALRTAFKYAKTEEDKNAISKKINNAETTISLLKRGFNNSEINRMSEGEIAQILNTSMSRGMYFEGLRNKEEFAKNIAGKEAVALKKEIEPEASKPSNGGNPALRSTEDVNKIDEELLKAETFLKDAESKGEKERAEFYRNEVNYLKNKPQKQITIARGQEGSSETVQIKGSENANNQKKYIQNLGYSNEEILNLSVQDMNRIVENQITRDQWLGNKTTQPSQEDESATVFAEDKSNLPSNQVGGSSITVEAPKGVKFEVSTTLPDGSSFGASSGPGVVSSPDSLMKKSLAGAEQQTGSFVAEVSKYDERKDILEKNGWTKEKYDALSKKDQDGVYWGGIHYSEDVSDQEVKNLPEEITARINQILNNSLKELKTDEKGDFVLTIPKEDEDFVRKNQTAFYKELDRRMVERRMLSGVSVSGSQKDAAEKEAILLRKSENKKPSELENTSVDEDVMSKLESLGVISVESIKAISPEFLSLSREKQIYLLSKLEQKIYLDADITSKVQTDENIKKMGFFKKMYGNLKKGWSQVSLREELIKEYKKNAIERYGDLIPALAGQLAVGPELKYVLNKDTQKLVPEFQYFELDEEKQDNFYWNKKYLNESASKFGEIPKEWSSDRAPNRERSIYKKAEVEYERRKELLLRSLIERGQAENPNETEEERRSREAGILIQLNNIDGFVKTSSALSQNPELGGWSKEFFEKVAGGKVTNRVILGGALAFGAGIKKLTRQSEIAGVTMSEAAKESLNYAGLGFSTVFGGYMGYRKKNLEYKEKELRQQYGIEAKDKGVKKFIDAKASYEGLKDQVKRVEEMENPEKKNRLLERLQNRIFLIEERMDQSRVNYGDLKDEAVNKQRLLESLTKAKNIMLLNNFYSLDTGSKDIPIEHKLYERFTKFIGDKSAEKYKTKQKGMAIVFGAVAGGAGYYAGGLISEKWTEYGVGDKIKNLFAEIPNPYKEGSVWLANSFKDNNLDDSLSNTSAGNSFGRSSDFVASPASIRSIAPEPSINTSYETFESVDVGGRGMIGGIDDLQDKLREKFGNNIPGQYQEFMAKKPEEVAREWGVYRPGEENESAKVFKGAKFEIGKNGEVIFTDHEGSSQKVFEPTAGTVKNFNGEFFDSGNRPSVSPESSFTDTDYESGADARPASPEVNEGYVTTRTIKPETTSWYEKPVPTEYGASPVRGSWKFIEDANGNIVKVDTSRTISDDVIKFRQNPRNFMTADLSQTNLLAKTDSFAVKTLTDNRELVEKFLVEKNLLDAPPAGVTDKELTFLKESVAQTNKELQIKTGGAFDGKLKEEPSIFGRVEKTLNSNPTRVVSFDTDAPIKPRVSPSVTSVSEGSDFVPSKTPVLEKVEVEVDKNKVFEPELSRVSTGTLEKISSTNEEITYSFKTENVKGPIRFTLNKDGVIDGIQTTASTLIKGQENPTSILKDGWESSASKYSSDTSTGIKKIRLGAGVITKYQEILRSGGFNSNSPEYKYLNGEIEFLKNKFKDVLK